MFDTTITEIASILGGLVGGLFTYFGVKKTINNDNKKYDFENKKKVLPLLKPNIEEFDYKNIYIDFSYCRTKESESRKRKNIPNTTAVSFSISNVGPRELYDFHISNIESNYFKQECDVYEIVPIIYPNDKINFNFFIYEMGNYDNDSDNSKYDLFGSSITFNCYFKDCYNNWYFQTLSVNLFHKLEKDIPIDKPALIVSIEKLNVISAPIEIKANDLPWKDNSKKICKCAH